MRPGVGISRLRSGNFQIIFYFGCFRFLELSLVN